MRGRRNPPILVARAADDDPSQAADAAYFNAHPSARAYTRPLIAGESPEPLPPGTTVYVQRIGQAGRARAFCPPKGELN
jgi:hypothetical protein